MFLYWPILTYTAIALFACLVVTFDRHCSQALCPLDQSEFLKRRVAPNATVHLQRSKQFIILGNNVFGPENMQTKKRCVHGDCGKLAGIVPQQANERNYAANLTIESMADSIQYFREGRAGRN